MEMYYTLRTTGWWEQCFLSLWPWAYYQYDNIKRRAQKYMLSQIMTLQQWFNMGYHRCRSKSTVNAIILIIFGQQCPRHRRRTLPDTLARFISYHSNPVVWSSAMRTHYMETTMLYHDVDSAWSSSPSGWWTMGRYKWDRLGRMPAGSSPCDVHTGLLYMVVQYIMRLYLSGTLAVSSSQSCSILWANT